MSRLDLQAALENANVRAFLRAIRLGEGTSDEAGYYRIVGGGSFSDDSKHPGVKVYIQRYDVYSTAAGAYQIINGTWNGLVRQYGFTDFSPESQDLAAVALGNSVWLPATAVLRIVLNSYSSGSWVSIYRLPHWLLKSARIEKAPWRARKVRLGKASRLVAGVF